MAVGSDAGQGFTERGVGAEAGRAQGGQPADVLGAEGPPQLVSDPAVACGGQGARCRGVQWPGVRAAAHQRFQGVTHDVAERGRVRAERPEDPGEARLMGRFAPDCRAQIRQNSRFGAVACPDNGPSRRFPRAPVPHPLEPRR